LEGTETENVLETNGSGELAVKTANAPNYALSTATTGTPVELYNCDIRNASKLLLMPGGGIVDTCYLSNAGEDGIHASVLWANLTVTDTLIELCGNLRYHSKVGWTTSLMHADLIQIRGTEDGVTLALDNVSLNGRSPGTNGGPDGDGWGVINAAVMAQTGSAPIDTVTMTNCWIATGGNWSVYMEKKNHGQVKNFTLDTCQWSNVSASGPLLNHGASDTATITGNTEKESGDNIDALLSAGGAW